MDSESKNTTVDKKQKFLKEQIMDDPDIETEHFVQFLKEAKPEVNGEDINNWEFEELVDKVQEYKTLQQQLKSKKKLKENIIPLIILKQRPNSVSNERVNGGTSFPSHFGCCASNYHWE